MQTESADDATLSELMRLARISPEAVAPRLWLDDALRAARGTLDPQLVAIGATRVPQPSPAKHNAPLKAIERDATRLIAALKQLRGHPYAYASFWRFRTLRPVYTRKFEEEKEGFATFEPVYANAFEDAGVMRALTTISDAARKAQLRRSGRPRNVRKQHIVDLALAFCARFSPDTPSSDINNVFPRFAKRFFERATGLSVEQKGHGIDRQIRVAMRRLPIEKERAALLKKYSSQTTAGFVR
jgi:hypothetical protein